MTISRLNIATALVLNDSILYMMPKWPALLVQSASVYWRKIAKGA